MIHKVNAGLGPARNSALDIARGEYLFFVDSDDYITNGIIKKLYDACVENNADIVCCGYQSGKQVFYCGGKPEILKPMAATAKMLMCENMDANAVCKLYKRELFEGIRYPACAYEVVPVTYKVFLRAESIVNIKECGYYIEKRPGSITRTSFGRNNVLYLMLSKEMQADIKKNYTELTDSAEIFYLNALITMTEKSKEDKTAIGTEEYRFVNDEFKENYKKIIQNSKISRRKKLISLLIHYGMYGWVKKIYDRIG